MLENFYMELRKNLIDFWMIKMKEVVEKSEIDDTAVDSIVEFSDKMIQLLRESKTNHDADSEDMQSYCEE